MDAVTFGQYAAPAVLALLLSLLFGVVNVSNNWKPIIAAVLGIGISMVAMIYKELPWTPANIIDHAIYGLMMIGTSAVGLYELQNKGRKMMKKNGTSGRARFTVVILLCFISIISISFFLGCKNAPTPTHQAYQADRVFDEMWQEWKSKRAAFQPETRFNVDQLFEAAHYALVAWEDAKMSGLDSSTDMRTFLDLKTKILLMVGKQMGWITEAPALEGG